MLTPGNSPALSGWAAMAIPVSKSADIYNFTLYQAIPGPAPRRVPTISTSTGVDPILRTFKTPAGVITIHSIGTVGVATTSTATVGSFSGGGGIMLKRPSGLTFEGFVLQTKAGATATPSVLLGMGWAW